MKKYLRDIVLWAAFMMFMTFIIEITWNNLVPSLFHGPTMTYQQASSVYVLILVVAFVFKVLNVYWPS